jgi:hypothetical protein
LNSKLLYTQSTSPCFAVYISIVDIDIIRGDIRDTGLEKKALFHYRIKLIDESLIEITERILEERGGLTTTKYRYHWQTGIMDLREE